MKPKRIAKASTISACLLLLIAFTGCKKSDVQKPASSVNQTSSDEVSFVTDGSNFRLSLRPGPNSGQDVYFDKEQGVGSDNVNYVPELCANAWTIDGSQYNSGFYIRFDSLILIPSSATVVHAKLYLYGLSNSLSTPQGDNGDNACFVKRVTSSWDESTLTFKNRPDFTSENSANLPASTSQWDYNAVVDVTAIVSYFVAHPSENYGFFIHQKSKQPYRSIVFGSSEQKNKYLRPKLVITYN